MVELIRKYLLDEIRQGKCSRIEIRISSYSMQIKDDGRYSLKSFLSEALEDIISHSAYCTVCTVNYGCFRKVHYELGMLEFPASDSGRKFNFKRLKYGRNVHFSSDGSTPSVDDLKQMARELCALYRGVSITVNGENIVNL